METDLSFNEHHLNGYAHYIHGFHDKKDGNGDFSLMVSKK